MIIDRVFRDDYAGEFIIHQRTLKNGIYEEDREWIPSSVKLDIASDAAIVFGNGLSRVDFDMKKIVNHKGGHLNKHKLYSYGCNALYRDHEVDFLVATNDGMVDEIVDSGYADNNIVYTVNRYISCHPGKFHMIPYGVQQNAGSMAAFMAAFDGFKKIYLVGFDTQDAPNINNNMYCDTKNYEGLHSHVEDAKWSNIMYQIFRQYHDVEFYRVMPGPNPVTPISWKGCLNYKNITDRQFVSYSDL